MRFDMFLLISLKISYFWHKTLAMSNTFPPSSAISLHSRRLTYVMKKNGNATFADIALDAEEYAWAFVEIKGMMVLSPKWDTDESIAKMDAIKKNLLQKCGCKKSECKTRSCTCIRRERQRTKLCTCVNMREQ